MSYFDPIIQTNTNYGKILPLQTHYGASQPYWAVAGSGGGSSASTINTQIINTDFINTSTITIAGNDAGFGGQVLNGASFAFVEGGIVDTNSVALTAGIPVCPYGTTTADARNVLVYPYGAEGSIASILTGGLYLNPGGLYMAPSTICAQITADALTNVVINASTFSVKNQINLDEIVNSNIAVRAQFTCGGAYQSTLNIGLLDGSSNALATVALSSNGITSDSITAVPGATLKTQQLSGLNTQHQVSLFNGSKIDLGQLMPMATVRNSSGGLEYATDSKIAQFGMMGPGSNFMPIPTTTYSAASNVVLAPYTFIQLYTGGSGSGGSTLYDNRGNANFSTFTAQPALNGTAYNSYKMFFGN